MIIYFKKFSGEKELINKKGGHHRVGSNTVKDNIERLMGFVNMTYQVEVGRS